MVVGQVEISSSQKQIYEMHVIPFLADASILLQLETKEKKTLDFANNNRTNKYL